MEKYSKEWMEEIGNIAARVVAASIAIYQMTENTSKYNRIFGEMEKSLATLEGLGFSIETDRPDINTIKTTEYYVVENKIGKRIFKFNENYIEVHRWVLLFTS